MALLSSKRVDLRMTDARLRNFMFTFKEKRERKRQYLLLKRYTGNPNLFPAVDRFPDPHS